MSLFVILVCLALQWSLNLSSAPYQRNWVAHYVAFIRKYFSKLLDGHYLFNMAILILPIVIGVSLIFTIVYHVFGHVGYVLLSLALLWYCVDAAVLKQGSSDLPQHSYQKIFSLLFWYFIFGPAGLAFYIVVRTLQAYLLEQQHFFGLLLGILDWVPVRLMGFSFAVVGNFSAVFKEWIRVLFQGIGDNAVLLTSWTDAALGSENKNSQEMMRLIQRALIAWLVVMALVTIGIWVG